MGGRVGGWVGGWVGGVRFEWRGGGRRWGGGGGVRGGGGVADRSGGMMGGEKVWRWWATRAEKLTRQLVPKRLQATWRAGYCWRRADVMMLRSVPKSCETALAFALEEVSGEGVCLGGVLALRKTDPIVQDCWTLLRLRQKGYCVRCGGRGHLAGDAAACEQRLGGLQGDELPYNQQRLERTLRALMLRSLLRRPCESRPSHSP